MDTRKKIVGESVITVVIRAVVVTKLVSLPNKQIQINAVLLYFHEEQ